MTLLDSFFVIFCIFYFGIFASIYLVMHFVEANGLYAIAVRRGIPHPGLAYVPVLQRYITGKIAEQFEKAQYGKTRNHTKRMLAFGIPGDLLTLGLLVFVAVFSYHAVTSVQYADDIIGLMPYYSSLYIASLITAGFTYPAAIFSGFAYYKVFRSIDPDKCTLFTILHVVLGVTTPFYILNNKNLDKGFIELQQKYSGQKADQN